MNRVKIKNTSIHTSIHKLSLMILLAFMSMVLMFTPTAFALDEPDTGGEQPIIGEPVEIQEIPEDEVPLINSLESPNRFPVQLIVGIIAAFLIAAVVVTMIVRRRARAEHPARVTLRGSASEEAQDNISKLSHEQIMDILNRR